MVVISKHLGGRAGTVVAVSYTHLDVYKRQALGTTSIIKFYMNRLLAYCTTSLPRGPETLLSGLPQLSRKAHVLGRRIFERIVLDISG